MNTLVAFPSTASFGQQAALAFHEHGALAGYLTSFAYGERSALSRLLRLMPGEFGTRADAQLKRRAVTALPDNLVETHPFWEIVRTLAEKAGTSSTIVDRIWDHQSHVFTRAAARRLEHRVDAIYAYEYTALEAFQAAERRGIAKILDFPSLNSRQFEELQRREKLRYPELLGSHEDYFDARFELRQARRDREAALADVIITNSSVTRASHVRAGTDPDKTFAVPYGAPPTIEAIDLSNHSEKRPLRAVWAGTFSIRKGAHYFLDAWRSLGVDGEARADVYGAIAIPERLWKPTPPGLTFHGSVIRPHLLDAFANADVLVFPTLSDGFGMVVTEAFSRGLPVITTDQAGASDLVIHGHNGLIVPPGDAEAIVKAVHWCLENRSLLTQMRFAALETAKNWQWSHYRQALVDVVQSGLARAGFQAAFTRCAAAA